METPYTVPEIARLTGIPETTLYDYVRQFSGVVPEIETTEENGRPRRRYPEQAIAVFQTIRHLKDRGVDLPTIRALLQDERTHEDAPADVSSIPTEHPLKAATTTSVWETDLPREPEAPAAETPAPEQTPPVVEPDEQTAPSFEKTGAPTEETLEVGRELGVETSPAAALEASATLGREAEPGVAPSNYPFFEAPTGGPVPTVSVTVEPVTPLEPAVVVEATTLAPPTPAAAATRAESAETAPAPPTQTSEPPSLATVAVPSMVDGEILEAQAQLLGTLEDGLRSLRAVIDRQNSENERLLAELKEQRDENERLRATLQYQKEQTRSAERLLAAIKSQCEQGISVIAE